MAAMGHSKDAGSFVARKDRIIRREEIEALIAEGRTLFIHDGNVLKADAWRPFHPGGDKAIMHMVGRDATDEVNASVYESTSLSQGITTNRS